MSLFLEVIVAVFPEEDRKAPRRNLLRNAFKIARWLGVRLRFAVSTKDREEISRELASVPNRITRDIPYLIDSMGEDFEADLSFSIAHNPIDLVVIGTSAKTEWIASDRKRKAMSAVALPLLILPDELDVEPEELFQALIVPMSGVRRLNTALDFAVRLGHSKSLPIDLLHVIAETPETCSCALAHLDFIAELPGSDTQRIFSEHLDAVVAQAAPMRSIGERRRVRRFFQKFGQLDVELPQALAAEKTSLPVLEWSGAESVDDNPVIREVCKEVELPIILVLAA